MMIDTDRLRADLIDYYGTAVFGGFPVAVVSLARVERLSDEEVISLALKEGFDLSAYRISE